MTAGGLAASSLGGAGRPETVVPRTSGLGFGKAFVDTLRILRANPLSLVGFVMVLLIAGAAVILGVTPYVSHFLLGRTVTLLPYDPNQITNSIHEGPTWQHWFGTDPLGRDIFSQILTALPLDILIGVGITGFAVLVGVILGLISGYWDQPRTVGGAGSVAILRVTDVFLAFPSLVLAIALAAVLGRGLVASVIALMITWWPYYVRLVRGEVLAIKHAPYVSAARAAGVSDRRILTRHILRNLIEPLIVYATLDIGTVIVVFSTISFVGAGVALGTWEWGNMVEANQGYLLFYPWMVLAPGLAIFVTVLAFSLFGDGMQEILDPRSRRTLSAPQTSTGVEVLGAVPGPQIQ